MNIIWSEKINLIQILLGLKNHPNTNTNIIRFEKITRIRIRILFGLKKSPEYEYEYYSVWKYQPNTNTNILVFEYYSNNIRIPNYSLTSVVHLYGEQILSENWFKVQHFIWIFWNLVSLLRRYFSLALTVSCCEDKDVKLFCKFLRHIPSVYRCYHLLHVTTPSA